MPALTLKNIPEPLLRRLRKVAKDEHRSLNQQVISMLESTVDVHRRSRVDDQLAAWRKITAQWTPDETPELEAKKLVARRTSGRKVDL